MSNVLVNETSLQNIANAIRTKNGSSDTYTPSQMATAISNIPSGGGGNTKVFRADSLSELNLYSSEATTGDIGMVYSKQYKPIYRGASLSTGTVLTFPQSFTISDSEQLSSISLYISNNDLSCSIDGYSTSEITITIYTNSNLINIIYTSQDGMTYTTDGNRTFTLTEPPSSLDASVNPYDQSIEEYGNYCPCCLITTEVLSNIYKYSSNQWTQVSYETTGYYLGVSGANLYEDMSLSTVMVSNGSTVNITNPSTPQYLYTPVNSTDALLTKIKIYEGVDNTGALLEETDGTNSYISFSNLDGTLYLWSDHCEIYFTNGMEKKLLYIEISGLN